MLITRGDINLRDIHDFKVRRFIKMIKEKERRRKGEGERDRKRERAAAA